MKHNCYYNIYDIEITTEFDIVTLISATADDIKTFACFRDYIIVNPCINERYNQNINIKKLIQDATEQRSEIVNLINRKKMNYDFVLINLEDKEECKILKELLKVIYKIALYTADNKEVRLNEDGLLCLLHLSRMDNLLKRIFYLYSSKHISIRSPVLSNF